MRGEGFEALDIDSGLGLSQIKKQKTMACPFRWFDSICVGLEICKLFGLAWEVMGLLCFALSLYQLNGL